MNETMKSIAEGIQKALEARHLPITLPTEYDLIIILRQNGKGWCEIKSKDKIIHLIKNGDKWEIATVQPG